MTTVRLLLALVVGLLLGTPMVAAAPARGELEVGALTLASDALLESAGLSVLSRADEPPSLELELSEVSVHRIGQQRTVVGGPASTDIDATAIDDRRSFSSARVRLEPGAGEQLLAMRGEGPSTAQIGGTTLLGLGGALLGSAVAVTQACGADEADYCLDVLGVYEISGAPTRAELGGPISLLLYGPTLLVEAEGETASFTSGVTTARDAAAAQQIEDAWVVLTATATGGSVSGDALRLYSAAPTLRASQVQLEDAQGTVRVGLTEYRASRDDVSASGALTILPGPVAPASYIDTAEQQVYADAYTARISGDVASIDLDGAPAFLDTPAEKAGAAAILLALAGGLAYAWNHVAFLAAALYTRLNKPDILDNDVRNRIYDIIVHNPGISAREVHRQSEQSWGTVVYHLRQLERHHLVVSRALGRTRNYYENHGKYRGMEVQLACLQSDRALTLAREIANAPGITQEQLAERCRFPQPTTSYYVRKLKQAGLIEEQREGRYAKYVPHADLPRYIALSDHQPQIGGATSSGVQA